MASPPRRLIVLALAVAAPLVAQACGDEPAARDAPGVDERAEAWTAACARLGADAPGTEPAFPRPSLLPALGPEEVKTKLFMQDYLHYDPIAYFRLEPFLHLKMGWDEHPRGRWIQHTNSLGLREDAELPAARPDVLVLVIGDSHTEGVCDNAESFANVLESQLSAARPGQAVDVLNTGVGTYSFANYLGALVRFLPLAPDVVVLGVFGGNDFAEGLLAYHARAGSKRPTVPDSAYFERQKAAQELGDGRGRQALYQGFNQLAYFERMPEQAQLALATAREHVLLMQGLCAERGTKFVLLYIPPAADVTPADFQPLMSELQVALQLDDDALRITDRLADGLLETARAAGISIVDGRTVLAGQAEPMYWSRDHHIDVAAHRVLAEALRPVVEAALR